MPSHDNDSQLKEIFARCQELDCKIMLAADEKSKATHAYFTQNYFLTCEDYYHKAADYMAEYDCFGEYLY